MAESPKKDAGPIPPKPRYYPGSVEKWEHIWSIGSAGEWALNHYAKTKYERNLPDEDDILRKQRQVDSVKSWPEYLKQTYLDKSRLKAFCAVNHMIQTGDVQTLRDRIQAFLDGKPLEGSIKKEPKPKPEVDLTKIDFPKLALERKLTNLKLNELQAYARKHRLLPTGTKEVLAVRVRLHVLENDERVIKPEDIDIKTFDRHKVDWTDRKYVIALLEAEKKFEEEHGYSFIKWDSDTLTELKGDLPNESAMESLDDDCHDYSCKVCKRMCDWREWHCIACDECCYGISFPCPRCQPELTEKRAWDLF
jgi:hypothetical protein